MHDADLKQGKGPKGVWLKAATLGAVWAALEIVLGSFLHNLRMPFTGTTLAACGVALLTASQILWKEPGVIWRAGLICALMKSISPSAVIFGPMIGILSEALVVQISVWILGRNRIALLIGGMLALLEPAIHKVTELIIEYGLNAGVLYVRFYKFAARTLHVESVGPLDLVAAYFILHLLVGLGAVFVGMAVARRALEFPRAELNPASDSTRRSFPPLAGNLTYYPILLAVHFAAIIGGFLLIGRQPIWQSAPVVALYVAACLWRYANIRRVFRKPKMWIELLAVGILASLLLGNLTGSKVGWSWGGLEIGLQMALRAVFVTAVFASIGSELRNPRIIDWFMRRGMATLTSATTLAFEALPTMMAALSEEKQFFRHPVRAIAHVLATGIRWLEDYEGSAVGVTLESHRRK
jgi:hypothetical protein